MKKTTSIHIKGMNFLFEEDAYELLQDYMDRLNHGLRNEKGNKEIVEDIELRIAELCTSILNDKKQVIEIEDIKSILETLGDPSQYIDEGESSKTIFSKEPFDGAKNKDKHLFRDVDNATIAGVCAGIANYFKIDVVIIRAFFILLFLFGGFGFPLYIILWVIVPKANSTIDKLRMRGKAITVDSVREEVENAGNRLTKETNKISNRLRNDDTIHKRVSSIGRLISVLFGTGLILFGLFWLVILLIFGAAGLQFIPVQSDNGFLSLSDLSNLVLSDESDNSMAWIGGLTVGLSAIFFMLLLGIKIVFKIHNKWSKRALILLFLSGFIGAIICVFIGLKTGRDMTNEGEIERLVGSVQCEQLVIQTHHSNNRKTGTFEVKTDDDFNFIAIKGENIEEGGIHFEYCLSEDSLFHVRQNLSAHSQSNRMAVAKAKNIKHSISLDSTVLNVNAYYSFPMSDKLRDQEVYIIIEIPEGKSVKINRQIIRLGSDEFNEEIIDENYEEHGVLNNDGEYYHHD